MVDAPDDERVGTQIANRYRLDAVIGKGGMGVVYRGLHLWTERPVAVKLLATDDGENAAKRFLREARAAASVRHPNLVEVIDVGQAEDGLMFQVLELLEGESLLSHIERRGRMRPADVLDVLVPILDALAALHASNVIHRDLKPGNIFLSADGRGHVVPKLLDLGISKRLDADEALTITGALMGTPSYMSPEQARGEPDVGVAADIWAMGVVLYQCLTGERPFRSDSVPGLLHQIATERPPPIVTVEPNLPSSLAQAVDRALAYDVSERHASATAFADALVNAALEAGWPITCRIPSGPSIDVSVPPGAPDTLDPNLANPGGLNPAGPSSGLPKAKRADEEATPASGAHGAIDPDATPYSDGAVALPSSGAGGPGAGSQDATPISNPPPRTPSAPASGQPASSPRAIDEVPPTAASSMGDPTPRGYSTPGAKADPDARTGWMRPSDEEVIIRARGTGSTAERGPSSESVHLPMRRAWVPALGAVLVLLAAGGVGWAVAATQSQAVEEAGSRVTPARSLDDARSAASPGGLVPAVGAELVHVEAPAAAPPAERDDAGPPRVSAAEPPPPPRSPARRPVRPPRVRPPARSPSPGANEPPERGANNALIIE